MATTTESSIVSTPQTAPVPASNRLPALDWMRGLVMVLMAVDHAGMYDAGHLFTDSWVLYDAGTPLPIWHFLTRWITHLCAPTFLFLAGTALALSVERRRSAGTSARDLDRHLLKRGLILLAFEMFWVMPLSQQVLYAIGMSLICMIGLRRLSTRILLGVAVAIIVLGEVLVGLARQLTALEPGVLKEVMQSIMAFSGGNLEALLAIKATDQAVGWFRMVVPFLHPGVMVWLGPVPIVVLYPFLPWLAMMMLGWVLGRHLLEQQKQTQGFWSTERILLVSGLVALAIFAVVRGLNGYGNMFLPREDGSLVQWLHTSKYPPSITFITLELGLMALCLWGFFRWQRTMSGPPRAWNPLLVFGQTALFFYLLHIQILGAAGAALGIMGKYGLGATYLSTLGLLIFMYPLCRWYRRFKAARPRSWLRYI